MAKQAGFANAWLGKTTDDLPTAGPMLFVRAGRRVSLDRLVLGAISRNLPVSLINHAAEAHGSTSTKTRRRPEGSSSRR